jgi:hypothetical protein
MLHLLKHSNVTPQGSGMEHLM